jgi:hypothetical protein
VIRMVEESIHIRIGKEQSEVTCRFTFRSGKKEGDAKQVVGFPDFIDKETDTGSIREMQTFIDGRKVEAKKQRGWFHAEEWSTPKSGLGEPPPELPAESVTKADFYAVDVVFPAGKDVIIERRYVAYNGGNVVKNVTFGYTTHTGAVWQGSVGKTDFRVTLDAGRWTLDVGRWTLDDLAFEDGKQKRKSREQYDPCYKPNLAEWKVVSPTELEMTWKDFEPAVHKTRRGFLLSTWSMPER